MLIRYFGPIFLLLFFAPAYAQHVHITGKVNDASINPLMITKLGLEINIPGRTVNEIPYLTGAVFKATIPIEGIGLYKVEDGITGHIILLEPGDSIQLDLIKLPPREHPGKFFQMKVKARYQGNLTFFDELENKIGATIKYNYEEPIMFKNKCDNAYRIAVNLLKEYQNRKIVSDNFPGFAMAELNANYVLWLCELFAVFPRKEMPSEITSEIKQQPFNDSLFAVSTQDYIVAAAVYNGYILNEFDPKNWYANLTNEFNSIEKNYTGIVKEWLMYRKLENYIGKGHPAFDSILNVYLRMDGNAYLRSRIIQQIGKQQSANDNSVDRIPMSNILRSVYLKDLKGIRMSMAEMLKENTIYVIDCWATWCFPCQQQLPFIQEIEKKYKGKVRILYVSFDKEKSKWVKDIAKNGKASSNQYIFESGIRLFSSYFGITAIPHYILIGQKGAEVLCKKMPLPVQKEFTEILDKYLMPDNKKTLF